MEHILRYTKEAADFNEALPIGNGRIGGMVYGRVLRETVGLNEDSVWSGGMRNRVNPDAQEGLAEVRELLRHGDIPAAEKTAFEKMQGINPNCRHYMPLGDLGIDFFYFMENTSAIGNIETDGYERKLDISEAVSYVEYKAGDVTYRREYFISAPGNVLAVHVSADKPGKINLDAGIDGRDDEYDDNRPCADNMIMITGGTGSADGIFFAAVLSGSCSGGSLRTVGKKLRIREADSATLYVSARTSFYECDRGGADPLDKSFETKAIADVRAALGKEYESLKAEHIADYRKLYDRVRLDLCGEDRQSLTTDERLERFKDETNRDNGLMELYFNFGRYLMISGSRTGTQPLNLQGIWNKDMKPAWGSKYTVNINTEMNYWPAESCNLSECHEPLFELLGRVCKNGRKMAKEMYGIDKGFVCHHNTDIWGDAAPVDEWIPATIWPMSGAWLALHVYQHYEYTQDTEFLAKNYYLLKEAAEFFTEFLIPDEEGRLITSPSVSPENTYKTDRGVTGCLCMGPSMDSQIITVLFEAVIKSAAILDKDEEFASKLSEMLKKIPAPEIGKYGQIKEWAVDYDEVEPGHRHISQLFALHPADLITPAKTPELAKAAKATLERRLSHGGGHTGWSRAWIANMWARLYESDMVYENLHKLLGLSTNRNMFDNHPPFQIDGNFGGTSAIAEALLQCTGGEIILLPALPSQWKDGSVCGLKAKGNVSIDISWKDGKLTQARLASAAGGDYRIRYGGETRNVTLGGGSVFLWT
ncbi:MAG: glycoside hydrolase family 95 protein [Lachnospiraceae bacterium]|nr:glycoside hydrolase family 95 protein [Lachnospiraceae bacterium]